jgi:hypothetical protein
MGLRVVRAPWLFLRGWFWDIPAACASIILCKTAADMSPLPSLPLLVLLLLLQLAGG